ncbi:hypothetical protein BKA70DRAFT_1574336 [Coprinopsis sp. MPI-PUGE-AT-0042]|nr:hypothetical protein BKA70DRAFT_1574336 [Coprinopsis sp. MPI-PUGE-AT-0042]
MPRLIDFIAPTLLVYDYVCTLREEVEYMWKSRWSVGLIMFYVNRYLVFVDQILLYYYGNMANPSKEMCRNVFKAAIWIVFVGENVSTVIVFLQTCAIWRGYRWIVYPLGALQCAKVVVSLIMMLYIEQRSAVFRAVPSPKGEVCRIIIGVQFAKYRYTMFILLATSDSMRHIDPGKVPSATNSPWILHLYKNGVLFSVVALFLSIASIIVCEIPWKDPAMRGLVAKPQRVLDSLLCNRIMFVIFKRRQAEDRDLTGCEKSWRGETMTGDVLTMILQSGDVAHTLRPGSTLVELEDGALTQARRSRIA